MVAASEFEALGDYEVAPYRGEGFHHLPGIAYIGEDLCKVFLAVFGHKSFGVVTSLFFGIYFSNF